MSATGRRLAELRSAVNAGDARGAVSTLRNLITEGRGDVVLSLLRDGLAAAPHPIPEDRR